MELWYFFLGIIFIQAGIPLIDEFLAFILSWLKVKEARWADIINTINIKIKQDAKESESDTPEVLGFGSCLIEKEEQNDI